MPMDRFGDVSRLGRSGCVCAKKYFNGRKALILVVPAKGLEPLTP